MKLIIATTVLALTAGGAFAQDTNEDLLELTAPEIAFVEAATIANDAAEGELVSMYLDYVTETDPVYLAELESDTGFARLMIDGGNGDVLVSETLEAQSAEALDAYMENFSMQAEIAEMFALQDMVEQDFDDLDLTDEELETMMEDLGFEEEDLLDDVEEDADLSDDSN